MNCDVTFSSITFSWPWADYVLPSRSFLTFLPSHQAHGTAVVPPIMVMLGKMPEVANYDLSSLKLIIVGAAPLGNLIDDLQIKL